jgi:hypothetical protein
MDRGGSKMTFDPLRSISLYKQSSFLATWAVRSTQYSTSYLLVTFSNTLTRYLSIVQKGILAILCDYISPTVSRDIGRYTRVLRQLVPVLELLYELIVIIIITANDWTALDIFWKDSNTLDLKTNTWTTLDKKPFPSTVNKTMIPLQTTANLQLFNFIGFTFV